MIPERIPIPKEESLKKVAARLSPIKDGLMIATPLPRIAEAKSLARVGDEFSKSAS
jgi:hypothetical protein